MRLGALIVAFTLTGACATPEAEPTTGPALEAPPSAGGERPGRPIELSLRRSDGTFLEVGELRGDVVLLFVFATFDATSQMALTPLRAIAERYPDTRIVGIAAQPSARLLIEAYEIALSPPFPITYDPLERVATGDSSLGAIEGVPTFIVLDRDGREVARHLGFADEPRLVRMLEAGGARSN